MQYWLFVAQRLSRSHVVSEKIPLREEGNRNCSIEHTMQL